MLLEVGREPVYLGHPALEHSRHRDVVSAELLDELAAWLTVADRVRNGGCNQSRGANPGYRPADLASCARLNHKALPFRVCNYHR